MFWILYGYVGFRLGMDIKSIIDEGKKKHGKFIVAIAGSLIIGFDVALLYGLLGLLK